MGSPPFLFVMSKTVEMHPKRIIHML